MVDGVGGGDDNVQGVRLLAADACAVVSDLLAVQCCGPVSSVCCCL